MESLLPQASNDRNAEYLAAAEAAVRAYCGWHVAPVIEETLTLDGSGENALFLPSLRVESIIAANNDGTDLNPDDLEWSAKGYLRAPFAFYWTNRLRGVRIQLRHGFAEVPDIVEIVRAMAARAANSPDTSIRDQVGTVSTFASQTAQGVAGGVVLMEHERKMLQRYRIRGGA